jgi:hypothetical protein
MDLLEVVAYLDEELQPTDRRAANERFSGIFEAAVGHQRQLEEERKERRRLSREGKRRQRSSGGARNEKHSHPEEHLF